MKINNNSIESVIGKVNKSLNLKDKLSKEDMNKLGFCLISRTLVISKILGISQEIAHLLCEVLLESFDLNKKEVKNCAAQHFVDAGFPDLRELDKE